MSGTAEAAGTPSLSLQLTNFSTAERASWDALVELARAADAAGIDRVWVADHVAFGEHLHEYADPARGGTAGGRQPTGPDGSWLEPLTVLAVLAGLTTRVRLGTAVLLAALRTPAVLAKQVATLDVLSGGRVDLGVGIGWQAAEYRACGLPFERRGDLLDRTLEMCTRLWTERVVEVPDPEHGRQRIHMMPKPLQAGGVPIWVGGRINRRTVSRVARFGAGWIPWGAHVDDPGPGVRTLRAALAEAGRGHVPLRVLATLPVVAAGRHLDVAATFERVPALSAAGVTDVRLVDREGLLAERPELLEVAAAGFADLAGAG